MPTENYILTAKSVEALKGKWGIAIGASLVFIIIEVLFSSIHFVGVIAQLLIAGPFEFGFTLLALNIARGKKIEINQIFSGFNYYLMATTAYLLIAFYTILWLLLLIVPGIIASISYSMTFYILVDNPDIRPDVAIDMSKDMMYGYKKKFFYLCLRFVGWTLLCILTLGIGFLWLVPYIQVSIAEFYDDIKDKPYHEEIIGEYKG